MQYKMLQIKDKLKAGKMSSYSHSTVIFFNISMMKKAILNCMCLLVLSCEVCMQIQQQQQHFSTRRSCRSSHLILRKSVDITLIITVAHHWTVYMLRCILIAVMYAAL